MTYPMFLSQRRTPYVNISEFFITCTKDFIDVSMGNQRSKLQDTYPVKPAIFVKFENVTDNKLKSVLSLIKQKYSPVDNIPEEALGLVFDAAFSNIKYIVNFSLQNGIFPDRLKTSYITPIIKGSKLDRNLLSNFRPLSSTPFLAKIIEKTVHYN